MTTEHDPLDDIPGDTITTVLNALPSEVQGLLQALSPEWPVDDTAPANLADRLLRCSAVMVGAEGARRQAMLPPALWKMFALEAARQLAELAMEFGAWAEVAADADQGMLEIGELLNTDPPEATS